MKKGLSTILFGSVLLFGALLASCSENEETGKEPSVNGERTLTFTVSSKFEEADESARSVETPDTVVRELPNGLVMKAVLEEDRTVESRAAENVADGTQVLAIVVNDEQKRVHSVQDVTVSGGNLTVKVPDDRDVYIVFLSYNSATKPTTDKKPGDPVNNNTVINTAANTALGGVDAMMCTTGKITPSATDLDGLVFRHLFAQIKTTVKTVSDVSLNNETVAVNGLNFTIESGDLATISLSGAFNSINVASAEGSGTDPENTTDNLSTDYVAFIPMSSKPTKIRLTQTTLTVPIDIEEDSGTFELGRNGGALTPGKRYNVTVTLHCKDNSVLAAGASLTMVDNNYALTGLTNMDDLYKLLNSPNCIYGGLGADYTTNGTHARTQNNYYWVLKKEFRSDDTTTPSTIGGGPYDARVTPGVRASGRYDIHYATVDYWYSIGAFYRWGQALRLNFSSTNDGKISGVSVLDIWGPGAYHDEYRDWDSPTYLTMRLEVDWGNRANWLAHSWSNPVL